MIGEIDICIACIDRKSISVFCIITGLAQLVGFAVSEKNNEQARSHPSRTSSNELSSTPSGVTRHDCTVH